MKEQIYSVHLQDEMPRIGSGRRTVVVKVGRKWVYVRNNTNDPLLIRKCKIKLNQWNTIVKNKFTQKHIMEK